MFAQRTKFIKKILLLVYAFVSSLLITKFLHDSLVFSLSSSQPLLGVYYRKGEMYISSEVQAFRVVQNLMKLDFKSQEVNIEIIKKSADDGIEEKGEPLFVLRVSYLLAVGAR